MLAHAERPKSLASPKLLAAWFWPRLVELEGVSLNHSPHRGDLFDAAVPL